LSEAGSRKQEAGSRKQEAGSRKQEAGSRKQEAGSRKQEAGSRKQDGLPAASKRFNTEKQREPQRAAEKEPSCARTVKH
jgi:hypothetical protein